MTAIACPECVGVGVIADPDSAGETFLDVVCPLCGGEMWVDDDEVWVEEED